MVIRFSKSLESTTGILWEIKSMIKCPENIFNGVGNHEEIFNNPKVQLERSQWVNKTNRETWKDSESKA